MNDQMTVAQFEPHLKSALEQIIAHGLTPGDAAQVMLLYAVGALVGEMTEADVKGLILEARDQTYAWMTEMAKKAGASSSKHHKA